MLPLSDPDGEVLEDAWDLEANAALMTMYCSNQLNPAPKHNGERL